MKHPEERDMKDINHTMQLSAATLLAILLGSYLYSSSADVVELRYTSNANANVYLDERAEVEGEKAVSGRIQTKQNVTVHR